MSDTPTLGLSAAAQHLGVPVRRLRHAIRTGAVPAPSHLTATSPVSAEWLESVKAAVEAHPKALGWASSQKVPPFARYKGTSAWRKYSARVREYDQFRAKTAA